MSDTAVEDKDVIRSKIWGEEPETDNPFAARVCRCHGYDVYGDLLGKASWIEYLYLLFKGEKPSPQQARLLESLAVALANPGPRDMSIHAAMSGGVGGSSSASCLMAALGVGAGTYTGAREVYEAVRCWNACGQNMEAWRNWLRELPREDERADVWAPMEHPPCFDPYGESCATPVRQALDCFASVWPGGAVEWLAENREALEAAAGRPLALCGAAAAAMHQMGFPPDEAEMLFLLLRLPGAAVHALEQRGYGWRKFPFYTDKLVLTDDPGPFKTRTQEGETR